MVFRPPLAALLRRQSRALQNAAPRGHSQTRGDIPRLGRLRAPQSASASVAVGQMQTPKFQVVTAAIILALRDKGPAAVATDSQEVRDVPPEQLRRGNAEGHLGHETLVHVARRGLRLPMTCACGECASPAHTCCRRPESRTPPHTGHPRFRGRPRAPARSSFRW